MDGIKPIEMEIELDISSLTVDEIEILEEVTGQAFDNFDWQSKSLKWLRALAYIAGRRQDGSFTLEDAGRVPLISMFRNREQPAPAAAEGGEPDPTS